MRAILSVTSAFAEARAFRWLLVQLREEHPSVRYGACHGLRYHLGNPDAVQALRRVEEHDVDCEVRLAAHDVLNGTR